MISPQEILNKHWGFNSFRAPQYEIIEAVLAKQDVIALLPTGSGKSLCYQLPALILEGVCLVVSPLIALMQDQVNSLQAKDLKATYIKPKSNQNDIIDLFDTIKFGNYKFLFISPERLQSKFIQQKLQELQLSLIAVDEAHCISEWGHDFRPSYRNIKILKTQHPNTSFLTLTATATEKVIDDIKNNLELKNVQVFKKSFYKDNLAYQVFTVEDKLTRLEQIFTKTKTPAIVYVNSRKKTEEISSYLNTRNFKSSFYHGGLASDEKKIAFKNWTSETTRIMVATNAFGMGIDKANVGIVVHYDIPPSIENYVQESGRAGRNNTKAFAVLLKNNHDIELLKNRFERSVPTLAEVKKVHQKLYQNFDIAYGEFLEKSFYFHLQEFTKKYNFDTLKVSFILRILANNGIISVTDNLQKKSTIQFQVSSKTALNYAINNIYIKSFLNLLLRSYTGLHKQKVEVNEFLLAKKNNTTSSQIKSYFQLLHKDEILIYEPKNSASEIQFLVPREDDRTINFCSKEISQFIHQKKEKLIQLLSYLNNNEICRSIQLLDYFNEKSNQNCGICDVCLADKKNKKTDINLSILKLLKTNISLTSSEIISELNVNEKVVLIHLRQLLAEGEIKINHQNKYQLI